MLTNPSWLISKWKLIILMKETQERLSAVDLHNIGHSASDGPSNAIFFKMVQKTHSCLLYTSGFVIFSNADC